MACPQPLSDVIERRIGDFVLLRNGKPWIAIETKLAEQPLAPGLRYLLERVPVPS